MKKIKKRNLFLLIFIVFVVLFLVKSFVVSEQEIFLTNKKEFFTFSDKDWRNLDINFLLDNMKGKYYCAEKHNLFQKEIIIIGRLKQDFDLKKLFNTHNKSEAWNIYIPSFVDLSKIKAATKQLGISEVDKDECGYHFISHTIKSDPHYRQTMIEISGILPQDGWWFTLDIAEERDFCLYLKFR
jgi:Na+-transporting NADH:ubiquinone oxidoreductase subunit NqrC